MIDCFSNLAFKLCLIIVHALVRSLKYSGHIFVSGKSGGSGCNHDLSGGHVLLVDLCDLFHICFQIIIVFTVYHNSELVSSKPEYRAVGKCLADYLTSILDISVTRLMSLGIIYDLKVIKIKDCNGKFRT